MMKSVNSTITAITHRRSRSLWTALGLFVFLALGENASATWYAEDTGLKVIPLSTVSTSGGVVVFGLDATYSNLVSVEYFGRAWHSSTIFSCWQQTGAACGSASAIYVHPSPSNLLDKYYVAHIDGDNVLRLSTFEQYNVLNGWSTLTVDADANWAGGQAVALFQGVLYIIYFDQGGDLKCATYNGNLYTSTLYGAGFSWPTAVTAPDGLHVYFYDRLHTTLLEAYFDGMTWTGQLIDDMSGPPGFTNDRVGLWPSAIVFNKGNSPTINVFYTDLDLHKLRTAQLDQLMGAGYWVSQDVDPTENIIDFGIIAPVIHGPEMQVYYTSSKGELRVVYGTGPKAFDVATLDGPGIANLTTGHGGVPDPMGYAVTAVEVNGTSPNVFYVNSYSGTLRHAFWE
jgi:hypothetical protein